ncbi:hypothetical protein D4764_06G0013390 [Takifugu flavidus]|uniref:Uncharacterized protein n=1 Tax=Takifugu flavidus TaxID=433684 RepID=A0A5C6MYP7_9TELE|nr:hypothetical protein D4764_06G0013390 [Takifugu flavidus]
MGKNDITKFVKITFAFFLIREDGGPAPPMVATGSFVAGVNIESEKHLRWSCSFHCWHPGATLQVYKGRLAYWPAADEQQTNESLGNNLNSFQNFSNSNNTPLSPDWVVLKKGGVVRVLPTYQSHLATDLMAVPAMEEVGQGPLQAQLLKCPTVVDSCCSAAVKEPDKQPSSPEPTFI